jgi:hypothetical protein
MYVCMCVHWRGQGMYVYVYVLGVCVWGRVCVCVCIGCGRCLVVGLRVGACVGMVHICLCACWYCKVQVCGDTLIHAHIYAYSHPYILVVIMNRLFYKHEKSST